MRDYYLLSTADTIIHNPFGLVTLNGLSAKLIYFGNAFQKYGIEVQTSRVGKYKSAVEIFTGDKMSAEDRYQTTELIESLWNNILTDIGDIRNIAPETLADISTDHGYCSSQEALELGLVDESAYFDEVRDKLIDIGEFDEDLESFRQISFTDYLAEGRQRTAEVLGIAGNGQPKVAVVYAEGMIVNGEGDFDQVGGDRVSRELRKLRHNDEVKAIVLRINSPGGSPVASEVVLRELKLIKNEKPVVVSMGSLAASGGYWIAANADTIIAEATTITGSIGVFGIYPNFKEIANRTGITFDGVKTSKYADIFTIARPKTDDELDLLQEYTDFIYDAFIERVAEGRNLSVDEVKAIAEGRIWSGAEALEVGLVDKLGGLDDAIEHAVDIAGIKGEWQLIQVPEETDAAAFIEKFLGGTPKNEPLGTEGLFSQKLRQMQRELPWLKALNDPHGVYTLMPLNFKFN
jgi:protease-4